MPESYARAKWNKENTKLYAIRVNRNQDPKIIEFMEGKTANAVIKKALYLLMAQEEAEKAAQEENKQ